MAYKKDNPDWLATELAAPAAYTTTQTSSAIDLSLYRKAFLLLHIGDWTDGTYTPSVTTSATSGGSFAADTMLAGSDAFVVVSSETEDDTLYKVDLDLDLADNRWLKLVMTAAGTTTGTVFGASFVGQKKIGA